MDQSSLSSIEQTLINEFQQGQELVRIFRQYDIESFLQNTFSKLNGLQPNDASLNLESYTSLILHESNRRILRIDNQADRLMVKWTLAELFQAFIMRFVKPYPDRAQKFIQAVKTTCEFHHYDFEDARHFLRLYDLESIPKSAGQDVPVKEVRYCWIPSDRSFDKFVDELKERYFIYSKKEIRSLFDIESQHRMVRVNPSKILELAMVFDLLYSNGIISVKGQNGKFIPLTSYARVNGDEISYKVDPARMIERAKRKPPEFIEKQRKIMIWLRPIITSDCGKAVVKGLLPPTEA